MAHRSMSSRWLLHLVVFFSSFGVMSLELSASRLCMPYFGSSVFVWGTLLSVILVALSFGYWIGGRLADRFEPALVLGGLLFAGALWVAAAVLVAPDTLRSGAALGEVTGTLVVVSLLFLVPMLTLGAVTPSVLKLRIVETETVGRVSGGVFFVSSLGSILGTLVTTFVLVPFVGTIRSIALIAGLLALLAVATLLARGRKIGAGASVLLLAATVLAALGAPRLVAPLPGELFAVETPYSYVRVAEQDGKRFLLLNRDRPFESYNSVLSEDLITKQYYDMLVAAPAAVDSPRRLLLLGLGGGTCVHSLLALYPDLHIDAVEIDSGVIEAARTWFGVEESDRVRIFAQGARAFLLAHEGEPYDVVLLDVFRDGPYVPFHLTTREFFRLLASRVTDDGVLAANVAFLAAPFFNAVAAGFPFLHVLPSRDNHVLLAGRHEYTFPDPGSGRLPRPLWGRMRSTNGRWERWEPRDEPVFTDDRAAVELEVALAVRSRQAEEAREAAGH